MPHRVPVRFRRAIATVRRTSLRGSEDGATLVEFSLIFPIFMVLFMAIIEFSLAFNANLGINRASQDAGLIAAEAANTPGADCYILNTIESEITAPNRKGNIQAVKIQRTGPGGMVIKASNVYARGGTLTCTLSDNTRITAPYTLGASTYPESQRCNIVKGCPALGADRTTVDNIAVQISYRYVYQTPLGSLSNMLWNDPMSRTWTFTKTNVFRMEPIL